VGARGGEPILEINPRHDLVTRLADLGESDSFCENAAYLLLDEAGKGKGLS